MNPGVNLETSMVGPVEILFVLVRIQIVQGSTKSGRFFGRHSMSPFLAIGFSLEIDMTKALMNKLRDSFFNRSQTVGTKI